MSDPPAVTATLRFNLDDPEGERRLRECLDAPKVKVAIWEFLNSPVNGIHGILKYELDPEVWGNMNGYAALARVEEMLGEVFEYHGVSWGD